LDSRSPFTLNCETPEIQREEYVNKGNFQNSWLANGDSKFNAPMDQQSYMHTGNGMLLAFPKQAKLVQCEKGSLLPNEGYNPCHERPIELYKC
jgi:hypothetical protein